jgi:hypothetical protein
MTAVLVPLVLEAVERLEGELLRIHHNVRGIAAWPTNSAAEITSIRAAIRRAYEVTRAVRHQVLNRGAIAPSNALRASSLRARGIVLAVELSELERGARGLEGSPPASRFADVLGFKDYLLGEIGRINAQWIADTRRVANDGGVAERAILDRAEAAYASLGQDPNVAGFLVWAIGRESYALRGASRVLAALLDVRVPNDPDDEPTTIEVTSLPTLLARAASRGSSTDE